MLLTGAIIGSFYALMACGYTVIYGTVRLINFAHGDVYMLGAFIGAALLGLRLPAAQPITAVALSVSGTILAAGLIGYLIRWIFSRVKSRKTSFSPMIAGVGISLVIENGVLHAWGSNAIRFPAQLPDNFQKIVLTLGLSIALLIATELWVEKTKFGAAMRAVGIDHDAVRLMGISVERVIFIVFIAFSAIAGLTGYLAGSYYGSIQFLMGFMLGLKGFTAAVIGGIGNVRGALFGGWFLGLVEAFGGGYLGTQWTDVVVFSVLIFTLVLKPNGILGEAVVERM